MKVKDVTNYLETIAPLQLQEEYDNAGLIIGNGDDQIKGVLICLDITDEVLNEAVNTNCNLIVLRLLVTTTRGVRLYNLHLS